MNETIVLNNRLVTLSQVKLDRVLGLTVASNASLDCDPLTNCVVYPAGFVFITIYISIKLLFWMKH